jgi:hypothetical protein
VAAGFLPDPAPHLEPIGVADGLRVQRAIAQRFLPGEVRSGTQVRAARQQQPTPGLSHRARMAVLRRQKPVASDRWAKYGIGDLSLFVLADLPFA